MTVYLKNSDWETLKKLTSETEEIIKNLAISKEDKTKLQVLFQKTLQILKEKVVANKSTQAAPKRVAKVKQKKWEWGLKEIIFAATIGFLSVAAVFGLAKFLSERSPQTIMRELPEKFVQRYLDDVMQKGVDDYGYWCGQMNLLKIDIPIPKNYQPVSKITYFTDKANASVMVGIESREGAKNNWIIGLSEEGGSWCVWSAQIKPRI